jgi:hypothetical protein
VITRRLLVACGLLGTLGCSFSPLANRIDIGEEAFVVLVATGADGFVDLHAVPAGGGTTARITFTPLVESHPALSRGGDVLAFLRGRDTLPETPRDLVVMNLLNGAERTLPVPEAAGRIERLAWSDDGTQLLLATATGTWAITAPPAKAVAEQLDGDARDVADSALTTWLGRPRFARAFNCPEGQGVCLVGPSGDTAVIASRGRDAFAWGRDSVGWFEGDAMYVRSLGPATARPVSLGQRGPTGARQGTYAAP